MSKPPEDQTCPVCMTLQPCGAAGKLAAHWSAPHRLISVWRTGQPYAVENAVCVGSGKMSREQRQKRVDARNRKRQTEVEAHRAMAAVANDAVLEGRGDLIGAAEIYNLVRFALVDLHLRYPDVALSREPWRWVHRGKVRGPRYLKKSLGDIYCRFCGERLAMRAAHAYVEVQRCGGNASLFTRDVLPHTTPCALQSLAGLRIPVKPGTMLLPEEFRVDHEESQVSP